MTDAIARGNGSLPTIDVVIAARNEAKDLQSCLESIDAQDYPSELVRVFVVDNGSTDDTARIATSCGATVLFEPGPGPARARNRGIAAGTGELVAFFDAHCVASREWISRMAERFADARIGGCQAFIENRGRNPQVHRYLTKTGVVSNEAVLEDTVRGERNVYPWILSGNSMYRRQALADAGGFDEGIPACEDVDLAWRVVLLGYLLDYCPRASVIHYNGDTWGEFVRKARTQGRGSAVLARRYLPHGAANAFRPALLWSHGAARSLIALQYWAGYRLESIRIAAGMSEPSLSVPSLRPHSRFRPVIEWRAGECIRVSSDSIYWMRDQDTSVVVNRATRERLVLEGPADFIWRAITGKSARSDVVTCMTSRYGIDAHTAEQDLDEFVNDLIEAGVLLSVAPDRD